MTATPHVETFEFKSEVRQLLDLMIHSLYANKDVFLRELISNASDALDKLRFEAITDRELLPQDTELKIQVDADVAARTLTIRDNGIGMSREELVRELGTIARSGTKEFGEKLREATDAGTVEALIGQFGVGFYSSFIAAHQVEVVSRKAGTLDAARFESDGDGTFKVSDATRDEPGTTIVLRLREADPENHLDDFTDEWVLRRIIKKYSDFIQYPIELRTEREEVERDEEGNPKPGAMPEKHEEWPVVNSMKAIWTRPQAEVSDEEYAEFYRHIAHDWTAPLDTIALKAEGTLEYYALLFIPPRPPFDLYYRDAKYGLQLHVNRVLIMEESKDLLPDYLRFVKGVVDSADLSLNVSRETLQKDRRVNSIRRRLVKKTLEALTNMRDGDATKYATFWNAFGRVLKEGVVTDADNRERVRDLLLFHSSATAPLAEAAPDDESEVDVTAPWTSLAAYVERMKEGQDAIYYITGESRQAVEKSPHLEAFFERGFEVLYLTDPYDEIMLGTVTEFDGKKLQSVGKGAIELGTDEEKEKTKANLEEKEKEHSSLLTFLLKELSEHVKEVRLSSRLTTSAACLVGDEGDYSPHFQRLLRRAGHDSVPERKRILELNPNHSLVGKLKARYESDPNDPTLPKHAELLYGQALLAEGSPLPDPVEFSRHIADLMAETL